jgi:hypothetical protein
MTGRTDQEIVQEALASVQERLAAAEAERDAAIQERDGEMGLRRLSEQEAVNARARLERVEAALRAVAEQLDAAFGEQRDLLSRVAAFTEARRLARAVLSGVTPPHDNGESPVDDPECGTDIGPFAAGAVDE